MPRPLPLLLALIALATACAEPTAPPSKGLFIESGGVPERPYYHDFGVILDGTSPAHTYRFRNSEPNPVTINDILASCSCVVPSVRVVSKAGVVTPGKLRNEGAVCVIPPGDALEVEIFIDTTRIRRKNTDRLSTIRLRTSSAITPFHTLEMHVKVQQLIQATPWEIELGEVATNDVGKGQTVVIVSVADTGITLRTAKSLSPQLTVSTTEEERLGRQVWIVEASVEPGQPIGPWSGALQLIVDAPAFDPPERRVKIPVRATITTDIVLRPSRIFLLKGNDLGVELTVDALVPGTRFLVDSAAIKNCPPELYTASATPVAPDIRGRAARWKIRVKPTEVTPQGPVNAKLVVTLESGEVLEAALLGR